MMKVYLDGSNHVAIVFSQTVSTVHYIAIVSDSDSNQWDCCQMRKAEFFNNHRETKTDLGKLLTSSLIPLSAKAEQILRRFIMETTTIFAVTKTAEFIGRYATTQDAYKTNPKDAEFVMSIEDITELSFTKAQLNGVLELDAKELKATKYDDMIGKYWDLLLTKELSSISNKKEPKTKSSEPRVKTGLIHTIYNILTEGPKFILVDEFIADQNAKLKCFQSLISNIQNEKYSQGLVSLKLVNGVALIDEVPTKVVYNSEHADSLSLNLIAKGAKKMAKEKLDENGVAIPKAEGLQTKLRTFFTEGGVATKAELAEKFGCEVKNISDQVCYLKNPKFAGTLGAINLVTDPNDKTVCIQPEGYVVPEKIKEVKAKKAKKSVEELATELDGADA
ncbi:MAG: hypothetical protein JZU65_05540 [Chlorobium sp.]|nr:hypothetical protein [Chlorobium sp.]